MANNKPNILMFNVYLKVIRNLLIAFLFIVLPTQAQEDVRTEKERQALVHYVDKEYEESARLYEELLKKDYRNTYLLNQCGLSYYHLKKFEQSKEKFRLATLYGDVDQKETISLYYSNLSAAYSNLDEDEKAFDNALKAYAIDKSSNSRLWNAASMAQNLDRHTDCLKLMDEADASTIHYAFLSLYARCYLVQQNIEKAVACYESFFDRYDPQDDFVDFVIKDERNLYIKACLQLLATTLDKHKQDSIIGKIVHLQKTNPFLVSRQDLLNSFGHPKSICKTYNLDNATCEKVYRAWISDTNIYDECRFSFNAIQDYQKANQLAEAFLKNDVGEAQKEIEQIYFLSSLHLFLKTKPEKNNSRDSKTWNKLVLQFESFFEPGRMYSDKELKDMPHMEQLLMGIITAFGTYYKEPHEIKPMLPMVMQFFENIPNESMRDNLLNVFKSALE